MVKMLKKSQLIALELSIFNKYRNDILFRFTNEDLPFAYVPERMVYLNLHACIHPTNDDVFDMLHEIGHIMTNTSRMRRFEEEFYATEWAIKEAKKYGVVISDQRKDEYDIYIEKWRKSAIKRRAKNVPCKRDLTLAW